MSEDGMLTDVEVMVLSSIQVFIADPKKPRPVGFGSGFVIRYLDRRFLVSVSHVTEDKTGLVTMLETNLPPGNEGPILQPIEGIWYFDLLTFDPKNVPEDIVKVLEQGPRKRLDICFAEIRHDIPLLQPEMVFPNFTVPYTEKIELDMNHIAEPVKDERYGFYGKIRHNYEGDTLIMTPALKGPLTYHRTNANFHIFLAPEIIKDKEDYEGCSGAPILDSQQRLVGVACTVATGSKIIYAFPIEKCKTLLDQAIAIDAFL
ncbi:MAG TPA: hypothetical protein VK668_07070 [Mucilaginibacter sp.]|nr:hypothetical protein [Mucilaginibacter sp.]